MVAMDTEILAESGSLFRGKQAAAMLISIWQKAAASRRPARLRIRYYERDQSCELDERNTHSSAGSRCINTPKDICQPAVAGCRGARVQSDRPNLLNVGSFVTFRQIPAVSGRNRRNLTESGNFRQIRTEYAGFRRIPSEFAGIGQIVQGCSRSTANKRRHGSHSAIVMARSGGH